MQTRISQDDYKDEIRHFIGLNIDIINVLFDPNLFVGGFSLIHILNEEKKQAQILALNGCITYKNDGLVLEINTDFEKNPEKGKQFSENATKLKKTLLENKSKIKDMTFENDFKKATLLFENGSAVKVENNFDNVRPLSYDNDGRGYSVYFGQNNNRTDEYGFFRSVLHDGLE